MYQNKRTFVLKHTAKTGIMEITVNSFLSVLCVHFLLEGGRDVSRESMPPWPDE